MPNEFFYGPILRHLGEFGKIGLLLGENTRFLPKEGKSKRRTMTDFQFFFCEDLIKFNSSMVSTHETQYFGRYLGFK